MTFNAIGLMSGTSLDGLDICFAEFVQSGENWKFKILKAETVNYSESWENKLRGALHLNSENLLALHSEYGFYLGEKIQEFISKYSLEKVNLIASHGHTVFHKPHHKFTLQIGDGRAIKILNNLPVIYDFRSQDVLMGGNGAPLVPVGDELLFAEFDACINLGGFSNISFKQNDRRIAFDICPVNIVLNNYAQLVGQNFDKDGLLAQKGTINVEILQKLNELSFYNAAPPKSLGFEWVNENVFPLLENESPENILATFTEHAAIKIAETLEKYNLKKILFTGGGTFNSFLIDLIKQKCNSEIIIPEKEIIDFKEALIFAFMGVLKFKGENNVLASATGSFQDHSSGLLV